MNLTPADIDRIVAEVVRRLRSLAVGSSRETTSELRLSDKVITLQTLKGRLESVTRVIVDDRAVVTPAVKDELKQRSITWVRMQSVTNKARS